MPTRTQNKAASAGRSTGQAVGGAVGGIADAAGRTAGGVADAASRTAARAREEIEDVVADAKAVAAGDTGQVNGRDAAMYVGLAATAMFGVIEWPVAAAVGVGYTLLRRPWR